MELVIRRPDNSRERDVVKQVSDAIDRLGALACDIRKLAEESQGLEAYALHAFANKLDEEWVVLSGNFYKCIGS